MAELAPSAELPEEIDAPEQSGQGPGKPNLLEATYDYIKKEKMPGISEHLPADYYEFEEGILSDSNNLKGLHQLFKDQHWEGADLDEERFTKLITTGIKKKTSPGPAPITSDAAGAPAPPGLALPPTPTTPLPTPADASRFGEPSGPQPGDEEFIQDNVKLPGGPVPEGVGDVPPDTTTEPGAAPPPPTLQAAPELPDPTIQPERPPTADELAALDKLPGDARPLLPEDSLLRKYNDLPALAEGYTRVRLPDAYAGGVPEKTYNIPGSTEPAARYYDRPLSKEVPGEGEQSLGLAAARNFNNLVADGFKGLMTAADDATRLISNATGLERGGAFADAADVLEKTKKPVAEYYKSHDLVAHPSAKNLLMAGSDVAGMAVPLLAQAVAAPELRGGQLVAQVLGKGAGLMFTGQFFQGAHDRAVAAGMNPDQTAVYTIVDGGLTAATFELGGALLGKLAGKLTPEGVKSEIMRETYRLLAERPAGQQLTREQLQGVLALATAAAAPRLLKIAAEGGKLGALFGVNEAKTILTEAAARQTIGAKFTQPTLREAVTRVVGATTEGAVIGGLTGAATPAPKRTLPLGRTPQGRPLSVELSEQGEPARFFDDQGPVDFGKEGPPPAVQAAVAQAQQANPAPLANEQLLSHQKVPVFALKNGQQVFADYDLGGKPTRAYAENGQVFSLDDPAVSARVAAKWPDAPTEKDSSPATKSVKNEQAAASAAETSDSATSLPPQPDTEATGGSNTSASAALVENGTAEPSAAAAGGPAGEAVPTPTTEPNGEPRTPDPGPVSVGEGESRGATSSVPTGNGVRASDTSDTGQRGAGGVNIEGPAIQKPDGRADAPVERAAVGRMAGPDASDMSAPKPYATPAENRAAGAFEKDGQVYTRQAPLGERVARGKAATAEFSSGVQQPVQYAVMEAADLQPSHLGGSQNLNHFLPEAQPKNRSAAYDPASQKAIADIAASPDLGRLGEAPNAYSGAPIVNQRGEALQGNGRAAGVREHYRTGGESYRRDVVAAAEKAGIPAEQTAKFKEPVLVRVADVSDAKARELGNYSAADTESGGKRRLDARQAAGRMDDEGRTTLARLATPQGEATLTETIRGNGEALLRYLRKAGLVNETQLQTMVKSDGTLTPSGVEDIAALYRHQLFREGDPNLPELYAELPAAAQGGLDRAVGSLLGVPPEKGLVMEVQNAIGGVREYLSSGVDFNTWKGQADMFKGGEAPATRYSPLELKLIEKLTSEKRPTYIARLFNEYAAAVKGEGASLFGETSPKSRAEAVKEVFGVTDGPAPGNARAEESAPRPVEANGAPEPPEAPGVAGEARADEALPPADGGATKPAGAAGVGEEPPTQRPTQKRLQELDNKRQELFKQLEEARKQNPANGAALATLVPLPTITTGEAVVYAKLAANYLETGLVKAQDILAQLKTDAFLMGGMGRASDEDLYKVIQYAKDDRAEQEAQAREVQMGDLAQRQADLEKQLFGSVTASESDFKASGAGKVTGVVSRLQERLLSRPAQRLGGHLNELTSRAAASKNTFARELVYAVNSISKGFVQTREQQLRSEQFLGQARERPAKEAEVLYNGLTEKLRDAALDEVAQGQGMRDSLRRLDRVLDPDFYEARTRPGFEQLLADRMEPADFNALDSKEIDAMFSEHTSLLSAEQLAASGKLEETDLTDREQGVLQDLKKLYNFVHDANFAIGKLSHDTWQAGRDEATGEATYTARLYQPYELPPDLEGQWNTSMDKGRGMQTGLYQQRQELEAWKIANKIEDPVFAAVKRLRQTMANRAIYEYGDWLAKEQPHLVVAAQGRGVAAQEVARAEGESRGFVQLGPGYGALSGTWVAPHIAEDFRGAFFTNKFMQRLYEITKAYGSGDTSQHLLTGSLGKVRNLLKKTVTVYNPGTHMGNILNNVTLGWFAGVDGVTMAAEEVGAAKELKEYSPTVRYLLDRGVLGGSLASGDFKQNLENFTSAFAPAPPKNIVARGLGAMEEFYQSTDTVAKVALFRALVKQGLTAEAAADRVAGALQNNKRVGKLYDVGANIPVVGAPFVRWSADLARVLATGTVNRPLQMAAFTLGLKVLGTALSHNADETDAERQLRERGAGRIPLPQWLGGNVSTSFKISKNSALDVSRWFIPFYLYGGYDDDAVGGEVLSKFSPIWLKNGSDFLDNEFDYTSNPTGPRGVAMAKMSQDMLLSPIIQLAADADFRGKSISDHNSTEWYQSTATPGQKSGNQAHFAARSAFPGVGPLLDDVYQAARDRENYYGKKRTVGMTIARFLGFKMEQFGTEQYQTALVRTMKQAQSQIKGEIKLMKQVPQDVQRGLANGSVSASALAPRLKNRSTKLMEALDKYRLASKLAQDYMQQKKAQTDAKRR